MKKALVLYGSSRQGGNTEFLTDVALQHAEGFTFQKIYLRDYRIGPIVDERHSGNPFPDYQDDYQTIFDQMMKADVIIFSTPVYWYNMSTLTKVLIDRFTESLRSPSVDMKKEMQSKQMYVIMTGANPNEEVVQPMVGVFQLIAKYFKMEFGGYFWANADKPGDAEKNPEAIQRAAAFFQSKD